LFIEVKVAMATTNYSVVNEILNFDGLNQFLAKLGGWVEKLRNPRWPPFGNQETRPQKKHFRHF